MDRVSFAGGVVKTIARAQRGMANLFQYSRKSELVTDDELRRVRLASISPDQRRHDSKPRVRLGESDDVSESHLTATSHMHRRPTAFVHPAELLKLKMDEEEDDDDDEDEHKDNDENKSGQDDDESHKVRIQEPDDIIPHPSRIHRRLTAFEPLGTFKFNSKHLDDDNDNNNDADDGDGDDKPEDDIPTTPAEGTVPAEAPAPAPAHAPRPIAFTLKTRDDNDYAKPVDDIPKVRKSAEKETAREESRARAHPRPPVAHVRGSREDDGHKAEHKVRPSILARLYLDNMFGDEQGGPTLKNYKPLSEIQRHNILLTHSPSRTQQIKYEQDDELPPTAGTGKYIRPSLQVEASYGQLHFQHGQRVVGKISSDYVNTIEQLERQHIAEKSIRGIEYARTRPAMSVSEYQRRNVRYQEEHGPSSNAQSASHAQGTRHPGHKTGKEKNKDRGRGLRLPGDAPLYYHQSQTTFDGPKTKFYEKPNII